MSPRSAEEHLPYGMSLPLRRNDGTEPEGKVENGMKRSLLLVLTAALLLAAVLCGTATADTYKFTSQLKVNSFDSVNLVYRLGWTTNFTPVRVEIMKGRYVWVSVTYQYYVYDEVISSVSLNLNASMELPVLASYAGEHVRVDVYYNDTDCIHSQEIVLDRDVMALTAQPAVNSFDSVSLQYNVYWSTNFQPKKIVVKRGRYAWSSAVFTYYQYDEYYTTAFNPPTTAMISFPAAEAGNRFLFEVYYGDDPDDYIPSDPFDLDMNVLSFVSEPTTAFDGMKREYTVSWETSFLPTMVVIQHGTLVTGYENLYSYYDFTNYHLMKTGFGKTGTKTIPATAPDGVYRILAYYADGKYVSSKNFSLNKTELGFSAGPTVASYNPVSLEYNVNWQTSFLPTRIEIMKRGELHTETYYQWYDWDVYDTITNVQSMSRAHTIPASEAGNRFRIYAYYGTGDQYKSSEEFTLPKDWLKFVYQPVVTTLNPDTNEYRVQWNTSFKPVKIEIIRYDSSNDWLGSVYQTLGVNLSAAGHYSIPAADKGYGMFCLRAYYGNGEGMYVPSEKFWLTTSNDYDAAALSVSWGKGAIANWQCASLTGANVRGAIVLYASGTGSWQDAFQIGTIHSVDGSDKTYNLTLEAYGAAQRMDADLYFGVSVSMPGHDWVYSSMRRLDFVRLSRWDLWENAVDVSNTSVQGLTTNSSWEYKDAIFAVTRGTTVTFRARPISNKTFGGWTINDNYCGSGFSLSVQGDEKCTKTICPRYDDVSTIDTINVSLGLISEGDLAKDACAFLTKGSSSYGWELAETGTYFTAGNSSSRFTGSFSLTGTYYLRIAVRANSGYAFGLAEDSSGNVSMNLSMDLGTGTAHSVPKQVSAAGGDQYAEFVLPVSVNPLCNVTFNMNGHGTAPEAQKIRSGSTAARPANPTASGYRFGGWYTEAVCTTRFSFNTPITGDITLYAKWSQVIDSIDVWAEGPSVGRTPAKTVTLLQGYTDGMRIKTAVWQTQNPRTGAWVNMSDTAEFAQGKLYRLNILVEARSGFTLASGLTPTVNGEPVVVDSRTSGNIAFHIDLDGQIPVVVSFNMNGYGSQIPPIYLRSGTIPYRPDDPTDPDARFLGYKARIMLGHKQVVVDYNFDQPVEQNTVLRVDWIPYISSVDVWMNGVVPGMTAREAGCFVSVPQGVEGYVLPFDVFWYTDAPNGHILSGAFQEGTTYWFRIMVAITGQHEFHPTADLTANILNTEIDATMFRFDEDPTIAFIDGSYTVGSSTYVPLSFDANGHGENPLTLNILAGTLMSDIFAGVQPYWLEDGGYIMTDWYLGDMDAFPLSRLAQTQMWVDANLDGRFVAHWLEAIPAVKLAMTLPEDGDAAEDTQIRITGEAASFADVTGHTWTDGEGHTLEDGACLELGQTYTLTVTVEARSGYGFQHPVTTVNGETAAGAVTGFTTLTVQIPCTIVPVYTISFDTEGQGSLASFSIAEGANVTQAIIDRFGAVPVLADQGRRHFMGWKDEDSLPDGLDADVTAQCDYHFVPIWQTDLTRLSVRVVRPMAGDTEPLGLTFDADASVTLVSAAWTDGDGTPAGTLTGGETCTLRLGFRADDGTVWRTDGSVSATVGGQTVSADEADELHWITCTFVVLENHSAVLPASLASLDDAALSGCAFTRVVIPAQVTVIPTAAFSGCDSLYRVVLPAGVTAILEDAFDGCPADLVFFGGNEYTEAFAASHGYRSIP